MQSSPLALSVSASPPSDGPRTSRSAGPRTWGRTEAGPKRRGVKALDVRSARCGLCGGSTLPRYRPFLRLRRGVPLLVVGGAQDSARRGNRGVEAKHLQDLSDRAAAHSKVPLCRENVGVCRPVTGHCAKRCTSSKACVREGVFSDTIALRAANAASG